MVHFSDGSSVYFDGPSIPLMENLLATGLALFAVALAVLALVSMSMGNLELAGFCFLSVSIILYFRETRVVPDRNQDS